MDKSTIKLAAFDMDGTLLNEQGEVTDETREACISLQASGCKLLIATGRTYTSAQLPLNGLAFDGYVCSNGATIYEADGTLAEYKSLDADLVIRLLEKIREQPIYYEVHDNRSARWMILEDRDRIESLIGEDDLIDGIRLRRLSFHQLTSVAIRDDLVQRIANGELKIVKVFLWHPDPDVLQNVYRQLEPWTGQTMVTSSGKTNIEIMPEQVNKWQGLQYFCRKWNIAAEEILAFGDAENDLQLLSHAGHSVAMGNASPVVKQTARYEANRNAESGVARYIRELLR